MNLRQMQRTLAEVLAKCEDIHVQLPVDPFDGMLSAGEALRHSRVGGKFHPDDAVDELKQRYGLEPKWQQIEDAAETKRRQHKRHRLRRGDESPGQQEEEDAASKQRSSSGSLGGAMTSDTDSAGEASASSLESASRPSKKQRTSTSAAPARHGSSRIDRIIENNPAKNPVNEELAEEFVELGGYELEHGEKQKGISRMAVAKQIRLAEEPITSGAEARKLPHVGPSAAAKIDEVLQRGKMKALDEYEAEKEGKPAVERSSEVAEKKPATAASDPKQQQAQHDEEVAYAEQDDDNDNDDEHEEEDAEDEDNDDDGEDEDEDEDADDKNDDDWQDDEEESAEDD